jgi:RNA polymerase sigma-70 factor (ECF subfamily)
MIHSWCLKWGLQSFNADDVAHDAMVKLLTAMRTFRYDPARSFRAWLKTVTKHALGQFSASQRRLPRQIGPDLPIGNRRRRLIAGSVS